MNNNEINVKYPIQYYSQVGVIMEGSGNEDWCGLVTVGGEGHNTSIII